MTDLITKLEEAGEGSTALDALVNLHFHRDREYLWSLSGLNAQRQAWKDSFIVRKGLWSEFVDSLPALQPGGER
jgi:hypothetical protein